jgi:hypothetical protein
VEEECQQPTGHSSMTSPTLQTPQGPILLLRGSAIEVAAFQ